MNIDFLAIDVSSLDDLSIYECTTIQTINGEIVESEVEYA